MADVKISELEKLETLKDADIIPVVDMTDTENPATKNITVQTMLDMIYPVGSIYMSIISTNPTTLFGGTWEQIEDTFLLSSGSNYALGTTGGEATHTLTTSEMPSHTHTFTGSSATTSSNGTHNHGQVVVADNGAGSCNGRYDYNGDCTNGGAYPQDINTNDAGAHTHTLTAKGSNSETGGDSAHNNMPPYLVVNVWKRTA